MAQLNTTVGNIQLKENMIITGATATDWASDSKYPSAKAVADKISAIAPGKIEHPVGSVLITSTNVNPAASVGGTWTLIDKEYKSEFNHIDAVQAWTAGAATASGYIARSNHTIWLKMWLTTTAAISGSGALGTVERTKSGITSNGSFSYSNEGGVAYAVSPTDEGFVVRYNIRGDGYITIDNIYGSTKTLPVGTTIHLTTPVQMSTSDMDERFCNKFYWERTK